MNDNRQWFAAQDGQQIGPLRLAELQERVRTGTLRRHDLVWAEGMANWAPVASVSEVAAFSGAVPTPPPVPRHPVGYAQPVPPAPGDDMGQNAGMRMLLPVGRSPWAIVAGYLGLLSVIPIFAPFALAAGIIALMHIKRNPKLHGMGRAIFGIVMGGLFSLGLLFMIIAMIGR